MGDILSVSEVNTGIISISSGGTSMVEELQLVRKKKAVEKLLVDIRTKSFPLSQIVIFGSVLTEEFNERSDLDLCFVCEDITLLSEGQKIEIESYFPQVLGNELDIDFIYATPDKLRNGVQVFESIRKEGRILWQPIGI
jgi:predicted nucleotidyltransferase